MYIAGFFPWQKKASKSIKKPAKHAKIKKRWFFCLFFPMVFVFSNPQTAKNKRRAGKKHLPFLTFWDFKGQARFFG